MADVDAIKELADVLPLDGADLLNERARARDVLDVVALKNDLVLDVGRALNSHARQTVDHPNNLTKTRATGEEYTGQEEAQHDGCEHLAVPACQHGLATGAKAGEGAARRESTHPLAQEVANLDACPCW